MKLDVVERNGFSAALHDNIHRVRVGGRQRKLEVTVAVNAVMVNRNELVAGLQSRRLKCRVLRKSRNGRRIESSLLPQKNHHQHKAENNVHNSAHNDDDHPLPNRFPIKGMLVAAFAVFPFHGTETADGKRPERIFCFAFLKMQKSGPHADGKFVDADAAKLRGEKMAEFVNENHKSEQEHRNQN